MAIRNLTTTFETMSCLRTILLAALLAPTVPLLAQYGSVSAASPEAAEAGRLILAKGGNAADAAVAVSFALGVTEPCMSGLGGGTQVLLQVPMHDPLVINGTTFAPAATPVDATKAELKGHRATTIPTTVRVMHELWNNHGSGRISWAELIEPAIHYAEEGFVVGRFRAACQRRYWEDLKNLPTVAALFLKPDGTIYEEGEVFRQPVVARTLRRLAEHGAGDFYQGKIAEMIAADMAANGGWITKADLASLPVPRTQKPLTSTYRDWTVHSLPPPASGWVVLQALNLLEQSEASALAPESGTRDSIIPRVLMIAHKQRARDSIQNIHNHEPESSERLSKEVATALWNESEKGGETTHFSVIDAHGMAVAITSSINNYFGARAASPELGFLYNDYMVEFGSSAPGHPQTIGPGAMPYSSMSATILAKGGRPHLALGSPGSARIISAVTQVVQLWADGHAGIAESVAYPRWHVIPPNRYYAETESLRDALKEQGGIDGAEFPVLATDLIQNGRNAYFGGVHAVTWNKGITSGAADPRRDGAVATVTARDAKFPTPGPGRFIFTDPVGREIPVWYWAPANPGAAPVHFVFHGVGRNADDYRDQWINVARAKNVLLIVPEFTAATFPGSRCYNNGNITDHDGTENPREAWSFAAIEPLFDAVRARFGSAATDYTIYGHSAGSQFAHRFLLHKPGARVRQAVFANAGSYTFPWPTVEYPHGLQGARVSNDDMKAFYARRATILLGDADTDPNYPSLDRSENALKQGLFRFERGKAFFIASREFAEAAGWEFNWDMQFVPDVAHSNTLMAPAAGEVLFPAK